ncbi:MAG: hypothetical protein KH135_01615 [Firmicutes bacterium]|nr:hypothetical protein [Bacillota bacterium]
MKNGKNTVIGFLIASLVVMSVGYALISQQLQVNGTAEVTSTWSVGITAITEGTATGSAENKTPATYTGTTATFDTVLKAPGDSMTYDITVTNNGSIDAVLNAITITPEENGNNAILYEVTGVSAGTTTLEAGTTNTITVKVEWDRNVTEMPTIPTREITVVLNYIQK